jgi:uncharacterized protein
MPKRAMPEWDAQVAVLRRAEVGTLSLITPEGAPYGVPLNFAWFDESEYQQRCAGIVEKEHPAVGADLVSARLAIPLRAGTRPAPTAAGEPLAPPDTGKMPALPIGRIVFHCALSGLKLDCLARDPRVCFSAYSGLRMVLGGARACDCAVRYESVLCYGTACCVENLALKTALLAALTERYTGHAVEPPGAEQTRNTGVVLIDVTRIDGKRNVDPE